jgi:hypothetical protein
MRGILKYQFPISIRRLLDISLPTEFLIFGTNSQKEHGPYHSIQRAPSSNPPSGVTMKEDFKPTSTLTQPVHG